MDGVHKVNLAEAFARFHEHWRPKIAGALNESYVKLAKLQGEFVWHHHAQEDELFLVVQGRLLINLRDANGAVRELWLEPGEFAIIPRGVEHQPVAAEEVHVLLLEPQTTVNTGSATGSDLTTGDEWLPD
ncbi:MAG: cupin domain-containing protein [Anaerolineae bacterium]|nr:cupin domain-containing protein [Anaerolineae bacterium]